MTNTTSGGRRYLTCADTAKLLRQALKAEFPGVRFGVRSHTYAGGASIDVDWTDGPRESVVKALTDLYRGATFDGMTDMKSYHSTLLADPDGTVSEVHFGADFIFTRREYSPEFLARCEQTVTHDGRVTRPEQCRSCGNWMQDTDCYVAHTEHFDFVCSPACGATVTARYVSA